MILKFLVWRRFLILTISPQTFFWEASVCKILSQPFLISHDKMILYKILRLRYWGTSFSRQSSLKIYQVHGRFLTKSLLFWRQEALNKKILFYTFHLSSHVGLFSHVRNQLNSTILDKVYKSRFSPENEVPRIETFHFFSYLRRTLCVVGQTRSGRRRLDRRTVLVSVPRWLRLKCTFLECVEGRLVARSRPPHKSFLLENFK